MPLKDLLSKAPSPLPPSEEPWPRPDVSNNYKQSPLYSTIARPTLDEFLRTNYLMIPDFVLQVNQAKIAAWMGRSGQDVPNTVSQQSMANLGGPAVTSSVGNRVVYNNSNDKEITMIENGEIKEKDSKPTPEIPNTKRGDNLFTVVSQKRLSCDEIPPPLKPKPRVKKVMKGGSLVIIPAPQPRNRALQATSSPGPSPLSRWRVGANNSSHHHFERREDSGDEVALQVSAEDGSKNMLPVIKSINGKDGEHMFDMPERSHVYKETVTCDSEQLAKKDDTTIPCQGANDLHKEVSTRDDKRLGSGVPTAECEQKQVTLPVCRTDISLTSKPTTDENLNNSSNDPGSTACTRPLSVADKSIVLLTSQNSEMKEYDKVSNKCLQGEFPRDSKRDLTGKVLIEEEKERLNEDTNPIENLGEDLSKDDVRTPPIVDHKEVKTSLATVGDTAAGLGPQGSISVVTQLVATESSKVNKSSTDLSHDLAMKSSYTMQSSVDNEDGQSAEEPSTDMNSDRTSHEKHLADKEEKHIEVIDDGDRDINCSVDAQNAHGTNADDLKDVDLHGCDTAVVDDNDNTNSDNESSTSTDDVDEDDDDDGDDVGSKDNSSDDSKKEYAELVMEDSNSEEEEEEYDIFPVGENDSDDKEEGEVKSDYEAEDMNLDSDTEAATGGITFYQDTTIGQRVKNSRSRQGEKQATRKKEKKKKRKASKKRAKAEKQAAKVSNRNHDPTSVKKNNEGRQKHMPESHKEKCQ
ncbi:hypothetical protein OS493_032952 [Desmophyllum pertusum]|uniref:Uncharacterized protein n=1 Tax=Desmophyllum pertusum TaxID=174260 RepID=A0A9W9Y835_9CNID|nr:hypothetical protein OS493_032952 [Desmophyllum pertusum]